MKKFSLLCLLCAGIFSLTACFDDDEDVEASMDFQGTLTRLYYTTPSDTVSIDSTSSLIVHTGESQIDLEKLNNYFTDAFESLALIGTKSKLTETVKVEGTSSKTYAYLVCCSQAATKLQQRANTVAFDDVLDRLFTLHGEDLKLMGVETVEQLDLTALRASFTYYNSQDIEPLTINKVFL